MLQSSILSSRLIQELPANFHPRFGHKTALLLLDSFYRVDVNAAVRVMKTAREQLTNSPWIQTQYHPRRCRHCQQTTGAWLRSQAKQKQSRAASHSDRQLLKSLLNWNVTAASFAASLLVASTSVAAPEGDILLAPTYPLVRNYPTRIFVQ